MNGYPEPGTTPDGKIRLHAEKARALHHIEGKIAGLHLAHDNIAQMFGASEGSIPSQVTDTDMVLIDMDPQDSLDFYLDRYKQQFVAGYTKETPTLGLRVFMRDFNKVKPNEQSSVRSR